VQSISFCNLLALTFIILKLCKVIDWSWWWVLSPIWIPLSLVILLIAVILMIAGGKAIDTMLKLWP